MTLPPRSMMTPSENQNGMQYRPEYPSKLISRPPAFYSAAPYSAAPYSAAPYSAAGRIGFLGSSFQLRYGLPVACGRMVMAPGTGQA